MISLFFTKMDTPSETSISWGPIISNALARIVLVLGFGSAIALPYQIPMSNNFEVALAIHNTNSAKGL